VKKVADSWNVYCTRFLIKAKQLDAPLTFVDMFGHEHRGAKGDYFVESVDGKQTILARKLVEDAYITMGEARKLWQMLSARKTPPKLVEPATHSRRANGLPPAREPGVENLPAKRASRPLIA